MHYFDYLWDLYPNKVILDSEIDIKKLGWVEGDLFEVSTVNGCTQLTKVNSTGNNNELEL